MVSGYSTENDSLTDATGRYHFDWQAVSSVIREYLSLDLVKVLRSYVCMCCIARSHPLGGHRSHLKDPPEDTGNSCLLNGQTSSIAYLCGTGTCSEIYQSLGSCIGRGPQAEEKIAPNWSAGCGDTATFMYIRMIELG